MSPGPSLEPRRDTSGAATGVVLQCALVVTCSVVPVYLFGALSPDITVDLGVGETRIGIAIGLFFVFAALVSPFVGRFAEHRGAWTAMRVSLLLAASSTLVLGTVGRGPATVLGGLGLGALSMALGTPAANLALSQRVRTASLGLAFGLKQASAPAGTLIAGLSLPLLATSFGWRATMIIAAALPLLILPFLRSPSGPPVLRVPVVTAVTAAAAAAIALEPAPIPPSAAQPESGRTMPRRLLVMLAVGFGFANVGASAAGTFMVPAAIAVGYSVADAGLLLAAASVAGLVVRIVVGWWTDRALDACFRTIGIMLLLGAVGYTMGISGDVVVFGIAALLMFGAGWGWNGLFSLGVVVENGATPAQATGFTHTGGYVGAALGPFLFGFAAENLGYGVAWGSVALTSIVGAVLMLAVYVALHRRPRVGEGAPPRGERPTTGP